MVGNLRKKNVECSKRPSKKNEKKNGLEQKQKKKMMRKKKKRSISAICALLCKVWGI